MCVPRRRARIRYAVLARDLVFARVLVQARSSKRFADRGRDTHKCVRVLHARNAYNTL